jgi:hypothetical protein
VVAELVVAAVVVAVEIELVVVVAVVTALVVELVAAAVVVVAVVAAVMVELVVVGAAVVVVDRSESVLEKEVGTDAVTRLFATFPPILLVLTLFPIFPTSFSFMNVLV